MNAATPLLLVVFVFATLLSSFAQETNFSEGIKPTNQRQLVLDKEADFPGGINAWQTFLQKNLDPGVPAKLNAPTGIYTVVAQFNVDTNGAVANIRTLTKFGFGMEQEVIRVIKSSGKWIPAQMDGKPVKVFRKQPITFQVADDRFKLTTAIPYVFFTGIDNELLVDAGKVKPDHLLVTITGGKIISMGNGRYTVRVSKTGRAVIRIFDVKKDKEMGAASFEVKDPSTN